MTYVSNSAQRSRNRRHDRTVHDRVGHTRQGETLLSAAVATYPEEHSQELALYLSWLAESCAWTGKLDVARATLQRTLEFADVMPSTRTDGRFRAGGVYSLREPLPAVLGNLGKHCGFGGQLAQLGSVDLAQFLGQSPCPMRLQTLFAAPIRLNGPIHLGFLGCLERSDAQSIQCSQGTPCRAYRFYRTYKLNRHVTAGRLRLKLDEQT